MSVESTKKRLINDFIIRLQDGLTQKIEPNQPKQDLQALNLSAQKI